MNNVSCGGKPCPDLGSIRHWMGVPVVKRLKTFDSGAEVPQW